MLGIGLSTARARLPPPRGASPRNRQLPAQSPTPATMRRESASPSGLAPGALGRDRTFTRNGLQHRVKLVGAELIQHILNRFEVAAGPDDKPLLTATALEIEESSLLAPLEPLPGVLETLPELSRAGYRLRAVGCIHRKKVVHPLSNCTYLLTGISQLQPGNPASPERDHLWLLPSGPDQIRRLSPRKTQLSMPHDAGSVDSREPSRGNSIPLWRTAGTGRRQCPI